uniref:Uncharacterized protein n=1 Tax=Hemiselmis andersenii TaxID=464988 RepID=A0A7S1E290_HEMAN
MELLTLEERMLCGREDARRRKREAVEHGGGRRGQRVEAWHAKGGGAGAAPPFVQALKDGDGAVVFDFERVLGGTAGGQRMPPPGTTNQDHGKGPGSSLHNMSVAAEALLDLHGPPSPTAAGNLGAGAEREGQGFEGGCYSLQVSGGRKKRDNGSRDEEEEEPLSHAQVPEGGGEGDKGCKGEDEEEPRSQVQMNGAGRPCRSSTCSPRLGPSSRPSSTAMRPTQTSTAGLPGARGWVLPCRERGASDSRSSSRTLMPPAGVARRTERASSTRGLRRTCTMSEPLVQADSAVPILGGGAVLVLGGGGAGADACGRGDSDAGGRGAGGGSSKSNPPSTADAALREKGGKRREAQRLVRGVYGFFNALILALCGDDSYEATEVSLLRSLPGCPRQAGHADYPIDVMG